MISYNIENEHYRIQRYLIQRYMIHGLEVPLSMQYKVPLYFILHAEGILQYSRASLSTALICHLERPGNGLWVGVYASQILV